MRRDASWYGGSPPAVWEMKRPEVYNVPDPESPAFLLAPARRGRNFLYRSLLVATCTWHYELSN